MKRKKLKLFKNGEHIQTLTFQRDSRGWRAVHYEHDKFMPTMLHKPMEQIKQDLLSEGLDWEWMD